MALFCLIIITKITKELWKFLQLTQESPRASWAPGDAALIGVMLCSFPTRMAECAVTSGETTGGSTFNARIQSQGPLANLPLRSLLFLD